MQQKQINEIISKFGQYWTELEADKVMSLIARDNLRYYESTFDEPTTDWDKVNSLWQIISDNQKNVTWWHEILLCDNQKALAHVKVTRIMNPSEEQQDIDGAFMFGIDDDGLINYFRQWRMLKS